MTHNILNRDPKDEFLKAFRLFGDDEVGQGFENLKIVAKELGDRMANEALQEMGDEANRDGEPQAHERSDCPPCGSDPY